MGRMSSPRSAPRLPHVIPYQGSKRLLAPRILATVAGQTFNRLYEPFAGSAAITIAAAHAKLAQEYRISDTLEPLIGIWNEALSSPDQLAESYHRIWNDQLTDDDHFNRVRADFNKDGDPAKLLYLLVRCVKNSPRFNAQGAFNQSPDKRRKGMHPDKMRRHIAGVAALLAGHTDARCIDASAALADAAEGDLVYLDPPWEGTTVGTDKRYHQGLQKPVLIELLESLNERNVPFILSYDGRLGDKTYGDYLPESLNAHRLELVAGRSSQATLAGRDDVTVESLYVSHSLLPDGQLPELEQPAATT